MSPTYIESLRLQYYLIQKYGLIHPKFFSMFRPPIPAELIVKDDVNINIDIRPKIILALQETYKFGIPQGFLYLFRYFRFYINAKNKIEYYFFNEKKCLNIRNSEQYLLTFMKECPEDMKTFDEMYDFHFRTGSDIITYGRSVNKITLTKSHLFLKVFRHLLEMKYPEYQLFDSNIISAYASYVRHFIHENLIFSDNLPDKPDYRSFPKDVEEAFKAYCNQTNNSYALGLPKLRKELKPYKKCVRMPFILPSGQKSTKPFRAYFGFKVKDPKFQSNVEIFRFV